MRNKLPVIAAAAVLAGALLYIFFPGGREDSGWDAGTGATPLEEMSWFEPIESEREVIVHCGNSMRIVMEEIAVEFQKRSGIAVVFNFGGSAELLPLIEFGGRGDLYICHDPYAVILEEKNLLVDYTVAGRLEPVILVQKGNPLGIRSMEDLAGPGIRVSSVDPRYATAGKMVHGVLDRKPWGGDARRNILIESRGHSDAALALLTGHVDAAIVWNFLEALYPDRLEKVSPGVDFEEEIRVTVCRLATSENTEEANELMEFITSDFGVATFKRYGYTGPSPHE